jgi:hypothetical protein
MKQHAVKHSAFWMPVCVQRTDRTLTINPFFNMVLLFKKQARMTGMLKMECSPREVDDFTYNIKQNKKHYLFVSIEIILFFFRFIV